MTKKPYIKKYLEKVKKKFKKVKKKEIKKPEKEIKKPEIEFFGDTGYKITFDPNTSELIYRIKVPMEKLKEVI